MNYITTTQLRTQTTNLLSALHDGETVDLIHRSQVVGEIRQKRVIKNKLFNSKRMSKIVEELNLPKLTEAQREKNYREAMMKKHGKYIS